MGVIVYPVLNKDVPGFDVTEMSGKALAAAVFAPNSAFVVLGNFYSTNEDELREFIAGEAGQIAEDVEVPAEEWFSPDDGLAVVRELFAQPVPPVKGTADEFAEWLTDDLSTLEKMLVLAQEHGALFHLAMYF